MVGSLDKTHHPSSEGTRVHIPSHTRQSDRWIRAQLPEFQRGWVWPDRNIAALLASISLGYPVGTVMMLRTGGDVRFKQRLVEGAAPVHPTDPDRLILDGSSD